MRSSLYSSVRDHRGAAAILFGALLPVLIGFTALAVDTSMIAVARGQLGTAADSAALAGAQQLATENRVRGATTLTGEITGANNQSLAFAQKNSVLGTAPVLSTNVTNSTTGEIVVGYIDWTNPSSTLDTAAADTKLFNSVQVTLNRDPSHGGAVPTIFANLMGFKGSNVTVKSTATAQAYSVSGFKASGSSSANLLPIVLDKVTWQAMMNATSPSNGTDQYKYDTSSGTVTSGPDGVYESLLYPVSSGSPGNWGTINVGVSNNSTSILGAQIRYGITPAQLATYPNSTIKVDDTLSPPSITFSGNPGISAGIKDDLEAIIGKPVVVPIYDINGGNGNNAWYRVIAFQPSRIVSVNFQGNPKYVIIQPCLINDPTAVTGTAQSWTKGGQVKLYLSR
jgi:Flp pilus assembly protein TadG